MQIRNVADAKWKVMKEFLDFQIEVKLSTQISENNCLIWTVDSWFSNSNSAFHKYLHWWTKDSDF